MSGHSGVYWYASLNLTFLYWSSIGNVLHWCRRLRYVWLLINCTHSNCLLCRYRRWHRLRNFLHDWLHYRLNHRCGLCNHCRCCNRLLNNKPLNRCRGCHRTLLRRTLCVAQISIKGALLYIPGAAHLLTYNLLATDKLAHIIAMVAMLACGTPCRDVSLARYLQFIHAKIIHLCTARCKAGISPILRRGR